MSINLNETTPGDLFISSTGELSRVLSYCEQPTITMEDIVSGARTGGGVNSLNMEGFIRLKDLENSRLLLLIQESSDACIKLRDEVIDTRLKLADRTMEFADLKMEMTECKELNKY